MRLFGRTSEASVSRRVADATALCEKGRVQEGRKRLEKLVSEAKEGLGHENRETLFAREALAMSYAHDAPERGLQLIEELLPEYERVFGKESQELLILRSHQPGLYGLSGDHAKARDAAAALVPECERAFGTDSQRAREMRANRAYAEGQLAGAELEKLLALPPDSAARPVPTEDWRESVRRAADHHSAVSAYRSGLVARFTGQDEEGSIRWQVEYVRPDKLHVLQLMHEQGEEDELADEWLVLGEEHYQNAGLWFKPDEDLNKKVNDFLTADKYLQLLRDGSPTSAVLMSVSTGSSYLVLDYHAVPAVFREYFSDEERLVSETGKTRVWIDTSNDTLARVDVSLTVESKDQKPARVEASQGFTSYGAEINIEAPELEWTGPVSRG